MLTSKFKMRAAPLAIAALAASAALLSGCVNLAPNYERPLAPVPAGFPVPPPANSTPSKASDIGWREFFLDERLRKTVELAMNNSLDLRVALLNIERAQAQFNVTDASLLPTLNADLLGTRARTLSTTSTTTNVGRIAGNYRADVGLASYELDFFSRVRNLDEVALQTFLATTETTRSTQITLVATVATAWLQLAADKQFLQLARNTFASQQKSFELIDRSHALGGQSGLALAQAQSTVDSARADVANYEGLVEKDLNALRLAVGSTPPAAILPPDNYVLAAEPAAQMLAPPEGLPSEILQQRPDVLSAEHTLIGSNANIGAARAALYPRITLIGSAGVASNRLSDLFGSAGIGVWTVSPSVVFPIFDGGLGRANVKVSEAQQKIQIATYQKTLQTAFREVSDALADRRALTDRVRAQQSLIASTDRAFQLSDALFRNGGGDYLSVLVAQRSLYSVQQTLIGLQLAEQSNRLTMYRVLGGGWTDVTASAVPVGRP